MEMPPQIKISNEEIQSLPAGQFGGRIVVVDDEQGLKEACQYLASQPVIGFDTETRPSFRAGESHLVALLQLSGADRCYLFRLCCMRFDKQVIKILEDKKILKIGADIRGDIRALHKLRRFRPEGFVDLQSIVWQWDIDEKSVRKMAAIVLGIRISKAQRLSNWEALSLTAAQQSYAATDAWACLEIFHRLGKMPKTHTDENENHA